jgi:hypothetical protein
MTTANGGLGGVFDADMYRPSFEAGISLNAIRLAGSASTNSLVSVVESGQKDP